VIRYKMFLYQAGSTRCAEVPVRAGSLQPPRAGGNGSGQQDRELGCPWAMPSSVQRGGSTDGDRGHVVC